MKKYSRKKFTLIELLAAMAVFSILLVVSMRLFSGAQQIWLRSEQKTDTFASARTAMEFMASRLQTIYYYDDEPFRIKDQVSTGSYECDSIWFISNMPNANGSKYLHFLKFRLVDPTDTDDPSAGVLQMLKYTGESKHQQYGMLFPPYTGRRGKNYAAAVDRVEEVFEDIEDEADLRVDDYKTGVDVIENVVGLKLRRFPVASSGNALDAESSMTKTVPYLIEIELRVLDSRDSFLRWQGGNEDEKDEIFTEHGYTFLRAVLLGKKGTE